MFGSDVILGAPLWETPRGVDKGGRVFARTERNERTGGGGKERERGKGERGKMGKCMDDVMRENITWLPGAKLYVEEREGRGEKEIEREGGRKRKKRGKRKKNHT